MEILGLSADWPGPEPPFSRCQHRPKGITRLVETAV